MPALNGLGRTSHSDSAAITPGLRCVQAREYAGPEGQWWGKVRFNRRHFTGCRLLLVSYTSFTSQLTLSQANSLMFF